jgi:hypothetical protein
MARRTNRPETQAASDRAHSADQSVSIDWSALLGEVDVATRDIRKLKPSQLVKLLNSTPLGEVISERQLHRHRSKAGYRVGDDSTVDFPRYVAWLLDRYRNRRAPQAGQGYASHRERARDRSVALSKAGREIGPLPEVKDPARKAGCERNLRLYCERYFADLFTLKWSDDHLEVISIIERTVLLGGLFSYAMSRGSGKTTIAEIACTWAASYGHRVFPVVIGPDGDHASGCLGAIKIRFETNDLLLEDFPEICYPIRRLEGITGRAPGQILNGELTRIEWSADRIVLPTVAGSKASGCIIQTTGITGGFRGMKFQRPDGQSVRPDLVLIDDPQTDESARSPSQCAERESLIQGAVLGLAGPGKKIAGLAMVTVIRGDDLADRLLNRERYPQWQGRRMRLMYALPSNEQLWAEYSKVRAASLNEKGTIEDATKFYLQHREAMDEGAKPAWTERFNPDEASAVQHAMNLKLDNEPSFWAEYQNDPEAAKPKEETQLSADEICRKLNNYERALVPITASKLTMSIDVQGKALYWAVVAWEEDFTGYVVDYGTEPDQGRERYFTLRELRRTLAIEMPNAGLEAQIYAGLERLTEYTLGREWKRDGGSVVRIDRCLIDANWGETTDLVYKFCRQSKFAALITPSHGRGIGPAGKPIGTYKRTPGDRMGLNWYMPVPDRRAVRHVIFDTYWWTSFLHKRLRVGMGDPSCLSLFGADPTVHRMLADHLTAEYCIPTEGQGRRVDVWKLRMDGRDNHLLDCLKGCAVAAAMEGSTPPGLSQEERPKTRRVSFAEMQRKRRAMA